MALDKDVGIPMRDGAVLRANVFPPEDGGNRAARRIRSAERLGLVPARRSARPAA
jgi:predicted acyl esterase